MAHLNPGEALRLWVVVVLAVFATTGMSQGEDPLIPSLPASQENSALANLWRHALRNQKGPDGLALRSDEPGPKTFLTPPYGEVINWVPQDSAHPLYVPTYFPLLRNILRDYMVQEEVKPDDPRLGQAEGLTVNNLNGKPLKFTKSATGISVNGVPVSESQVHEDGTVSYVLDQSLFNHREDVNRAWKENLASTPQRFGPFGRPLSARAPPPPPPPSD